MRLCSRSLEPYHMIQPWLGEPTPGELPWKLLVQQVRYFLHPLRQTLQYDNHLGFHGALR